MRDQEFVAYVAARQAHLHRIAYALCGDWHTAHDLVQTALTKLYVVWPRIQRDGREDAYVRQIIVRVNIDRHRQASARHEQVGLGPHDDVVVAHEPADDALFRALQELPEMQRKVVVLRHWLELSVRETAQELGISEGTVKSHASRGLAKLQTVLTTA